LATANGEIYFGAMAGPAGSVAAYGIFLTAGNAFTGLQMIAKSDGTSEIAFSADKFSLNTSSGAQNVFTFDNADGVFEFNVPVRINNAEIGDSSVTRVWFDTGSTSATVTANYRGSGFLEIYAQFQGDATVYNTVNQFVLRVT